jgi:geranylgeranyl pyrophosphate synthase
MTKLKTPINPLIHEVETHMQAQLIGNPSTLISDLKHKIQLGNNLTRLNLTFLFGSMFGIEKKILVDLAASIEMLQHAKSVHDDLAAIKSVHQIPNASFITSATVLAGDLAFAAAARLATAPQSTTLMRIFSQTLQIMVSGEITSMFQNGAGYERESYYRQIHSKTAALFELACQATAILAAMEDKIINTTRQFGYEIGMAFQIVQDILDFVADPTVPEKSIGNNLRSGIVNLPTIYYLETHPNDPDVQSLVNHNGHGPEVIDRLVKIIGQSGAIEKTLDEAKTFLRRGIDILENLPNTPARAELEQLAMQIIPPNF